MAEKESARVSISHDEWTLETLRIYLEATISHLAVLLDERQSNYNEGHSRIQEQVSILGQEISKLVTRAENDAMHARIDEQMNDLKDRMNRSEGKGQAYMSSWLIVVAAISTIGVIVGIFVYVAEHH